LDIVDFWSTYASVHQRCDKGQIQEVKPMKPLKVGLIKIYENKFFPHDFVELGRKRS